MARISRDVKEAIAYASKEFDVPMDAMVAIAAQESMFNPSAKASTSSASGLFQHIDRTWGHVTSRYGQPYGITSRTSRFDPQASALMGAALAQENAKTLAAHSIPVNTDTLYAAHFSGVHTAVKAFTAPPNTPASKVWGHKAIKANPFMRGKTVGQVLGFFSGKMAKHSENFTPEFAEFASPSIQGPLAPVDISQPPALGFAVPAFAPTDRPALEAIDGLVAGTGQPAIPTARETALAPFSGGLKSTGGLAVPSSAPGRNAIQGSGTVNIAPGHSQSINIDAMVAQNNAMRSAQQFGVSGYTGQPTTAPTPARSVNSVRSGPVTAARGRAATAKGDFAALTASEISGPFSGSSPAVAAAKAVQSTRNGRGLDTIDAEDPRGSQISAPTSHTASLARSIGRASPASPVNAIDALDPRGAQIAPPSQSVAPSIAAPPTSRNVAHVAPSFAIPDDVPVPT